MDRFPALKELFATFIVAIRVGDLKNFDAALDRCEGRLVDLNLWLILERAREFCMRSLFRRV